MSLRRSSDYAETTVRVSNEHLQMLFFGVVATLLRIRGTSVGWVDETNTIHWVTTLNYAELLTVLPVYQPHFPVWYLLLKLWVDLTGLPAATGRVLSMAAGVAAVGVAYVFARENLSVDPVIPSAMVALSPVMVHIGEWLRMYSLLALSVLVSWLFLERALRRRNRRTWTYYGIAALTSVYLHPFGLIALASQAVWAVSASEDLVDTARPFLALSALSLPAVGMIAAKFLIPQTAGEAAQVSHVVSPPTAQQAIMTVPALVGGTLWVRSQVIFGVALVALLCLGVVGQRSSRTVRLCLVWIAVPILATSAMSWTIKPVYQLKYLTWVAPAVLLLIAEVSANSHWSMQVPLVGLTSGEILAGLWNHEIMHALVANIVSAEINSVGWM